MIKATAFYPEYTGLDKLEENLMKVKDGGISAVRFGEFAWGLIEPGPDEDGNFNWEIFDRAFDLTEKLGISVILCTPTACPPVWLTEKYPSILPVNDMGQTVGFGARQHRCYNSPEMNEAAGRIVAALAKRYGKRKNLLAWQIDNELGAEHKYCYCDECRSRFQMFLKDKYKTIEALNERWMTTFWAQNYNDFAQVPVPKRIDAFLSMRHHPSLLYEFLRFSSDSIVRFSNAQAEIIRRYSDAPVTTNQDDFYYGDNVDWNDIFKSLDIVSFDIYTEKLYEICFYYDMCRNLKNKPFWQMEYGSGFSALPRVMDLGSARGCGMTGIFSFNAFPAGQEQGFASLLDVFGKPMENYYVFRDWTEREQIENTKRVYLYYDFTSSYAYNAMEYHTWETGFPHIFSRLVYREFVIHKIYKSLFESGYYVDVITSLKDADSNVPLVLPMQIVHNEELAASLAQFIEEGGHVIATNDLFVKNEDNVYNTTQPSFYSTIGLTGYVTCSPGEIGKPIHLGKGHIRFMDVKIEEKSFQDAIGQGL